MVVALSALWDINIRKWEQHYLTFLLLFKGNKSRLLRSLCHLRVVSLLTTLARTSANLVLTLCHWRQATHRIARKDCCTIVVTQLSRTVSYSFEYDGICYYWVWINSKSSVMVKVRYCKGTWQAGGGGGEARKQTCGCRCWSFWVEWWVRTKSRVQEKTKFKVGFSQSVTCDAAGLQPNHSFEDLSNKIHKINIKSANSLCRRHTYTLN
jgi:hypothetical protein